MHIRPVELTDASRLQEIYSYYVLNTAITFDYDVPSVEQLEQRIITITNHYPFLVIEDNGDVVGYAYVSVLKDKKAYEHSVEVSIYLDNQVRHKGYGKRLYDALFIALKKQQVQNVYACVAFSQQEDAFLTHQSVKFHEKLNFRKVGHFTKCGYKFNRYYDVIWMEKILNSD